MVESEEIIKEAMSSPEIEEWITSFAKRTEQNYRYEFPKFLTWLYFEEGKIISPREIIKDRIKQWISDDPRERGNWERIVNRYKKYLEEKDYSENTIIGYRRSVQSFFSYNRVPLKFRRNETKIRSTNAVDIKFLPTNSMIRAMYNQADTLGRAILLVAYHSSLAGNDIKELRIEKMPDLYGDDGTVDVSRHYYLPKARIKTGEWQQTFISTDALHSLEIHLRERGYPREGYVLVGKRAESKYSCGQLMPRTMNKIVKRLAKNCLSDSDSKRIKFKSIRDSFHDAANRALSVKGENRIVDRLMGQSSGNNAGDKYSISEQTMREAYEAIFDLITINDRKRKQEEYEFMNVSLLKQDELIKALTDRTRGLEAQLALERQEAEGEQANISDIMKKMNERIEKLEKDR